MKKSTFTRNNLDMTPSPYLQQHKENPVWWQPWSREVLDFAAAEGKPLFVSVGYATCHWCHVMAAEAFSDSGVADQLNRYFVSIKVDREERPDIDHFLMQFLMASRGQGGWPLNVFLTPDVRPFFALTYLPVEPRGGMPGFPGILDRVLEFYRNDADRVSTFDLWTPTGFTADSSASTDTPSSRQPIARDALHRAHNLVRRADRQNGGFGTGPKFPPHSTLLYLLHVQELYGDELVESVLRQTLNVMARRGLQDHLQGGFFRYCVDSSWTIPHFEKMLYDQAMALWVYSLAWKVLKDPWYYQIAEDIIRALEDSFVSETGLFISAHDADTKHEEGKTYLWSDADLKTIPSREQERIAALFVLEGGGNFEGYHHFARRDDGPLSAEDRAILHRLLAMRRNRPQPETDGKIVTAWNALTASAMVYASRYLERPELLEQARSAYTALMEANRRPDGHWVRSSLEHNRNGIVTLEDYGALLYLVTLLAEHCRDENAFTTIVSEMEFLENHIAEFKTSKGWQYALTDDLDPVPADTFDSPTPSPTALAHAALIRSSMLRGAPPPSPIQMGPDFYQDFNNLAILIQEGEFYLVETPAPIPWQELPSNALQRISRRETWCFRGACRPGLPGQWNPDPEQL